MENNKEQNSIIYLLAYVIPLLTGIIVYIIYGDRNKRFKFHGLQAILLGVIIIIFEVIFGLINIFVTLKFPHCLGFSFLSSITKYRKPY